MMMIAAATVIAAPGAFLLQALVIMEVLRLTSPHQRILAPYTLPAAPRLWFVDLETGLPVAASEGSRPSWWSPAGSPICSYSVRHTVGSLDACLR